MPANAVELGVIKIATPCNRDWNQMTGDERSRFCADCQLTVYNLSAMSTDEARELINQTEGKLCVRFYRRADGTVLTKDCPVGVKRYRRKWVGVGFSVGALSLLGLAATVREIFAGPLFDDSEASEQPEPLSREVKSLTTPVAPDNDEQWIEQRRNLLGPRVSSPGAHVMGGMPMIRSRAVAEPSAAANGMSRRKLTTK